MLKLIYHTEKNTEGQISPFDVAISEIIENQNIKIACPYISIEYLKKIVGLADNWKLLSDIDEWIISNDEKNRIKIKHFILENEDKIHHCKDLHAKVIITNEKLFIGSANFTKKGLTERNEVSVIIEDKEKVIELNEWFNIWWNETEHITKDSLNRLINSLPLASQNFREIQKLPSKNKKISTIFILDYNKFIEIEGTVRRLGTFYKDGKESHEININKKFEKNLPCEMDKRIDIKLKIKDNIYLAGLRLTKKNKYIWICPDLYNERKDKKFRLVDLLSNNGFKHNEKIILKSYSEEKYFELSKFH